jgi:IS4 transposase
LGDGGYASHELARFCYQHGERAALVSKFSDDAGLYDPPPQKTKGRGRRRVKGRKRLSPGKVVEKQGLRPTVAKWYGVTDRDVELCDGRGNWYKSGQGLVPIHWVFIRDVTGTRRDEYYYTTHLDFTAEDIVSLYTTRWTIEITFQELRAHLGFETPRQRVKNSVLRMGPCLMGLFSVVTLIYYEHLKRHAVCTCDRPCYTKSEPTFTDAMVAVRRLFWEETIFAQPYFRKACQKLLPKMAEFIFDHLCQAA